MTLTACRPRQAYRRPVTMACSNGHYWEAYEERDLGSVEVVDRDGDNAEKCSECGEPGEEVCD